MSNEFMVINTLKITQRNAASQSFVSRHLSLVTVKEGFTLLEVMISLAIVGGLLITLIYTLNYHLGIADRQKVITVATNLAKEKIYEMEKKPLVSSGHFQKPYSSFSYETNIRDSSFPGMIEIGVVVRNGKDEVKLSELIQSAE